MRIPPFWRYYGGKHMHAARYPEPLHGLPILEPFAGSAGYACRWGAGREVVLVDASPTIAGIWRWLISATPDDVLSIGDIPDGGTVDDLEAPKPARDLAGFWCNNGAASPCKRPSKWAARGPEVHNWGGWSDRVRSRIAASLRHIRRWVVVEGGYEQCPDVAGTWFVDPPYQGPAGAHYPHGSGAIDYPALGSWCTSRRGLVIVCESERADWMRWSGRARFHASPSKHRKPPPDDVVWCSRPEMLDPVWRGRQPELFAGVR